MHSKATVRYVCTRYTSTGRVEYHKHELLTTSTYRDASSLYWSSPKPISRATWEQAQRNGYRCEIVLDRSPAATIYNLEVKKRGYEGSDFGMAHADEPRGIVVNLLRRRLHQSMGVPRMQRL